MIKVLHIEISKEIGGIETFLMNLLNNIDRSEFSFDFITRYNELVNMAEFKTNNSKVIKVPSISHMFTYISGIKEILKKGNYDIVHIHKNSNINILPLLIVKRYCDAKIVVHSHNTSPSSMRTISFLNSINRKFVIKYADCKLACSDLAAKWLYGDDYKNYVFVPNGIDTEKFRYDDKQRNRLRYKYNIENKIVIGSVGRLSQQKNPVFALEIFYNYYKKNPNSIFVWIGDGNMMSDMKLLVEKMKIEEKVMLLGKQNHVERYYSMMDFFLMPSLYEGFPIAAIEAQTSGLPCLLSSSITKEARLTENLQYLDLDESKDVWAGTIDKMLCESVNRNNANNLVMDKGFDVKSTADKVSRIYCKLLGK